MMLSAAVVSVLSCFAIFDMYSRFVQNVLLSFVLFSELNGAKIQNCF